MTHKSPDLACDDQLLSGTQTAATGCSPIRVFDIDEIVMDMVVNTVGAVIVAIWEGIADGEKNRPFFTASPESTANG